MPGACTITASAKNGRRLMHGNDAYHYGKRAAGAKDPVRLGDDGLRGALRQLMHDQAAGHQVRAGIPQARPLCRRMREPAHAAAHRCLAMHAHGLSPAKLQAWSFWPQCNPCMCVIT